MKKSGKSSKSPNSGKSSKSGKSTKSKSKSLFNPMVSLATFASLMRTSNANHFTRQATIERSKKNVNLQNIKKVLNHI